MKKKNKIVFAMMEIKRILLFYVENKPCRFTKDNGD